jgi:UDP-2,3-diacylglucosamine pyrophosphatase LpxH
VEQESGKDDVKIPSGEVLILNRREAIKLAILTAAGAIVGGIGTYWIYLKEGILSIISLSVNLEVKPFPPERSFEGIDRRVVKDIVYVIRQARESGVIANKERNPWGDPKQNCVMEVSGDVHFPGRFQKDEAANRSPVIRFLLDHGQNQKDYPFASWALVIRPKMLEIGWRALKESILEAFLQIQDLLPGSISPENTIFSIWDIGDKCGTGSRIKDIAEFALEQERFRMQVENELRRLYSDYDFLLRSAYPNGNHDFDFRNHIWLAWFYNLLYGDQVFLQEVGNDYLVLSIDTNLVDPYFEECLQHFVGQPEFEELLGIINTRRQLQDKIIREALENSQRRVVVVGHDELLIKKAIRLYERDIRKTKITHIVCGHVHKANDKYFGDIRRISVGASLIGGLGNEKLAFPVGYLLAIIANNKGKRRVIIQRIQKQGDPEEYYREHLND